MENLFCTYNQSLALKELGFNKNCLAWYNWNGKELLFTNNQYVDIDPTNSPLKSQAFEFFREKYGLHSFVDIYPTKKEPNRCWFMIRNIDRSIEEEEDYMSGWFSSQEKAEIYCIDKLIENVKKQ